MTELAVLVPVLNRPQNVAPLVESFHESDTPGTLWFIMNSDDEAEIAAYMAIDFEKYPRCGRVQLEPRLGTTWARKLNGALHELSFYPADFYLLGADDITFTPGWWDEVMKVHYLTGARVIGTNDMANPRCIAGEHSTHTVVARSYIEELGTIDEPGKAVHDGYKHNFVDDELLWTARFRGEFAMAQDAIVAHHHPMFDTSVPMDETYALGQSEWVHDEMLFRSRCRLFGVQVNDR